MKRLEDVIATFKSDALDGRDAHRLAAWLSKDRLHEINVKLQDENVQWVPRPWTRDALLEQLKDDVAFGFEKALNQRGISSGLMFNVVMMWNRILEEGLENWDEDTYAQYGLPLFKATAELYGFRNPIGENKGDESKYARE